MKQPIALIPLFLTEMWERFGFYIVQGLLVFCIMQVMSYTVTDAKNTVGQFIALAYIAPVLGGICADRFFGYRYAILFGAIVLLIGYALVATLQTNLFFIGLATVVIGNSFLKSNISSFLGNFYQPRDPRRNSGFTIFYIGINSGIFLSTLTSGFIQRYFGWHACFATASLGMLFAIIAFKWGSKYFQNHGLPKKINSTNLLSFSAKINIAIITLIGIAVCYWLLKNVALGSLLLRIGGVLLLCYLIYITYQLPKPARNRMTALITLTLISIIFWGLYFQMFISTNLFIANNVDRHIFNILLPPPVFISLEAIFMFILGPLFAILWQKLYHKKLNPSTSMQFCLALFATAIAMELLVVGIAHTNSFGFVRPEWIALAYLMITTGELLLSPIGLSMVTRLAPENLQGLMMGVWFMALGFGGSLAGYLSQQAKVPLNLINSLDQSNLIYSQAFQNYALLALCTGTLTLLLTPWLKKLSRSPRITTTQGEAIQKVITNSETPVANNP